MTDTNKDVTLSQTQLAWLAGVLDCHGAFRICRTNNANGHHPYKHELQIEVSCKDSEIHKKLSALGFYTYNSISYIRPQLRDEILSGCIPYSTRSRRYLQLAIKFRETFGKWKRGPKEPLPDDVFELREYIHEQMKVGSK